ncbi:ABC transporter ATP-binding protein [Actinocorallia populi]|uniref:ABC transporter ATP-binding protein n=1 Tax=Actinocorallia populi TaxID=2079200 RepID=UPI000D093F87|nr:ABC transporter ATP-binding protein [Actinocorallia populi]
MSTAIRTRGLTHRFGRTTAVDGVDLTIAPGEIYGFLGRNGAGKTTLIRVLLGLITPTSGEVSLLGTPVRGGRTPSALWARVGYLVEGPGLYPGLTVLEHLRIAARYRGLAAAAVDDAVDRLGLHRYAGVRARALSLGNRQRLGLALALLHRPDLLILDEPVNGLDPAGVVDVRTLLHDLAGDGVTVFMSSHLIDEVARLADRIGIIHDGGLVEELSGEDLGAVRLVLNFRTPELARRAAAALRHHGIDTRDEPAGLTATDPEAVRRPDLVATRLVSAGTPPTRLAVEAEDLEEHFLRLTGGPR